MSKPKVVIEIPVHDFKDMVDFLVKREEDIADEDVDFWRLKGLFMAVFEEEPKR